jgi:hypothetical protein
MTGWLLIRGMVLTLIYRKVISLAYDDESRQWIEAEFPGKDAGSVWETGGLPPVRRGYIGRLKNGKPTGYGILTIMPPTYGWATTYCGWWKGGRFHGKGTLETVYSSHSHLYSGRFKDGLKHGYGRESALGWEYKGLYKNDEMCGELN